METALVDGRPAAAIDARDRGLHYGDGVFETLAVERGRVRHWARHLRRLQAGCERLAIPAPDAGTLEAERDRVAAGLERAVLKLIVTRGAGARGYRPGPATPTRIWLRAPWPDLPADRGEQGARLRTCTTRLGRNPALAGIKHCNRLEQVLARSEWDDPDIDDGVMLDEAGHVVECTQSNLFWVRGGILYTADVSQCGVAGVMREWILERAGACGVEARVATAAAAEVQDAGELLICNSVIGIWPVREWDGRTYPCGPITRRLQAALREETA